MLCTSSLCLRRDSSTDLSELDSLPACLLSLCLTTALSDTLANCNKRQGHYMECLYTEFGNYERYNYHRYNNTWNIKSSCTVLVIQLTSAILLLLSLDFTDETISCNILLIFMLMYGSQDWTTNAVRFVWASSTTTRILYPQFLKSDWPTICSTLIG